MTFLGPSEQEIKYRTLTHIQTCLAHLRPELALLLSVPLNDPLDLASPSLTSSTTRCFTGIG